MRTKILVAALVAGTALSVGPVGGAAADPQRAKADCTIVGTDGPDVLKGTKRDDVICGLAGDDTINGRGGDDILRGGQGNDTILGGPGDDLLRGGRGADHLDAHDLATDRDRLRCGRGQDTIVADVRDEVPRDCENVDQDNAAPSDLTLAPSSVAENRPTGTTVGTLTAIDPDAGDEHTFTLVPGAGGADNAAFAVVGSTLRTAASLDFETTPTRSVRVRVTDVLGLSFEKALTVTVTDADDAPVAVDDTATVTEDAAATAIAVLANDTDTDGGPKSIVSSTQPAHGTVVVTGGGSGLTYTPAADYCNTPTPPFDTFTYTLNGGDVGGVAVTVTCVDDLAVAQDDARTVAEDSGATAIAVLANDTDAEGDPFSVIGVTQPTHGVVSFTASGVSYTPAADYCTSPPPFDTFTYTITGGDTATVSLTVTCVNDAPVAVDDVKGAFEDTPLTLTASDLTANDTDPDTADTLAVTAVSNAAGGSVTLSSGSVTFTTTAELCGAGAGSFDYTVSDGTATDTGHVTVNVVCVDDNPVAAADAATVTEDSSATVIDVLANDTDAESDAITVTGVTAAAHGSTTFTAADVSFTPAADYCGSDSFTYSVDGGASATVSVTVTCMNDAPVVDLDTGAGGTGSSATFDETDPHTGTGVLIAPDASVTDVDDTTIESLTVVLTNRPDGDGFESLSATIPGGSGITGGTYVPATGTLSFTGSASKASYAALIASIRYDNTTNPPDPADRSITVTANDGDASSATATATVQVVPINVPPANTVPGAQSTNEDTALTFGGGNAISVTDPDHGSSSVEVEVTHGIFTLSGTVGLTVTGNGTDDVTLSGSLADLNAALNGASYTPTGNYNGSAQLTITSTDALSASDTDTVGITVDPVNDAPTATNLSAGETYTEDTPLDLVDIVVNDVDSSTATVTLTLSNPAAGSLSVGTSGAVTSTYAAGTGVWSASGAIASVNTLLAGVVLTPSSNFDGSFTIVTSVSDGLAPAVTGAKAVTGVGVNDAPVLVQPDAAALTYTEDSPSENHELAIAPNLTVSDIDDATIASATVTLATHASGDELTFTNQGGITSTGYNTGTGTLTLTGSATKASYQTALRSVKYRTTSDNPDTTQRTITFRVNDGHAADNLSNQVTRAIDVVRTNDAPVADDESFSGSSRVVGNTSFVVDDPTDGAPDPTGPQKTVSGDILAGDTDPDSALAGLTVTPVTSAATTGGGTITIEADGDFTYLPEQGCADTNDTYAYTLNDNDPLGNQTDTGTLTFSIADCVWYVDAGVATQPATAAGGTSQLPYKTLSDLDGVGGAGDEDAAGDWIFLASGSYNGGLPLENTQQVVTSRHGLAVPDGGAGTTNLLAAAPGASRSRILDGVVAASNNTIQGLDFLGSSTYVLSGSSVGTLTVNTVTSGVVSNSAGGGGVSISGAGNTLAVAFAGFNTIGGANGISLTNASGTFTAGATTDLIMDATSADVVLNGGSVDLTLNAQIQDDVGQLVSISGQTGGTKDFNGAITDLDDGDGSGVSLTGNTGATVRFDGGLALSTGGNPAFTATGGGTVVATGSANTLATTSGAALTVTGTGIGANGLTFRSISANGAPKAIVLGSTGAAGGLVVTGTGTAGTGGTIQNSSTRGAELVNTAGVSLSNMNFVNANSSVDGGGAGACDDLNITACNAAIYLNGVTGITLDRVNLSGTMVENGITGVGVSGLTMSNSSVILAGNEANESGMEFQNLSGTSTISDSDISFSHTNSIDIVNTDVAATLTFDNVTLRDTQTSFLGEGGIQFRSFSSAAGQPVTNLDIVNSDLLRLRTQAVQVIGEDDSIINVDVTGNTIDSQADIGAGIDINGNDNAQVRFNVLNNPTIQSRGGAGVNITSFVDAAVTGRINNNTIKVNGSGAGGSGIRVVPQESSTAVVEARNNAVTMGAANNSTPIDAQARIADARLDLTLAGNVTDSDLDALADINVTAGSSAAGETNVVCLDLKNHTALAPAPTTGRSLRLRVSDVSNTIRMYLEGFTVDSEGTWDAPARGNSPTAGTNVNPSITGSGVPPSAPPGGTCAEPTNPMP